MQQSPQPGWYPDPSNRRGQRFWDGSRWTDQGRRIPAARTQRPGWLVPVIIVGATLVVIGAGLVLFGLNRAPTAAMPPGSPSDAASEPEAGSTAPQLPTTDPAICQVGDPSFRGSDPVDGRMHGGGLAMPQPTDWTTGAPDRMTWAFDVALSEAPDAAGWAALGAVRIDDAYSTPEQASATITGCLRPLGDPGTLRVTDSAATTIPGAERAYEYSGTLQVAGHDQEFRVVVADPHSPESLAGYVRIVDPATDHHGSVVSAEEALAAA